MPARPLQPASTRKLQPKEPRKEPGKAKAKDISGISEATAVKATIGVSPEDKALPRGGMEEIGIPADGDLPLVDGTRSSCTEILVAQRGSPPTA